jgi:hypothetical protein
VVHFAAERAPGIEVLVYEVKASPPWLKFGPSENQQCPNVRFAGLLDCASQVLSEARVDQIHWGIGEHDVPDLFLALEADDARGKDPSVVVVGRSKRWCEPALLSSGRITVP